MKRYTIGDVQQKVGLGRIIDEMNDTQVGCVIQRHGQDVALMVPLVANALVMYENAIQFGKAVDVVSIFGEHEDVENYLLAQVVNGLTAQTLLGVSFNTAELLTTMRKAFTGIAEKSG